jgi:16S rRNA (guanine527-N7)-methyltransferase
MDTSQITKLLEPFLATQEKRVFSGNQIGQVSTYVDLLIRWNAKTNLTAVRQPEEIIRRHFGESFFLASIVTSPLRAENVIDVGSGAGFPGLPLAIYAPECNVTLIESQNKKATFLKEVVRALELKNVAVFCGRAESLTAKAQLVTMRAVEKFALSAQTAAALVTPGGRLALLIGESQLPNAKSLLPEFSWEPPIAIPESNARVCLVGKCCNDSQS